MTHRSRSGGPGKTYGKKKEQGKRKLHHPPPPPLPVTPTPALPEATASTLPALPARETPFNPPDTEVLALIHRALHATLSADEFPETVQKIKGLLYEKKWLEVFCGGGEGMLESYAGRWVPSRACCFRELMAGLVGEVFMPGGEGEGEGGVGVGVGVEAGIEKLALRDGEGEDEDEGAESESEEGGEGGLGGVAPAPEEGQEGQDATTSLSPSQTAHHVLSLGGGAGSELLAISALIRSTLLTRPHAHPTWTWTGVDIGNWSSLLQKLERAVRADWHIADSDLSVEYIKGDLMASPAGGDGGEKAVEGVSAGPVDLSGLLSAKPPTLITLFFTLAELLAQSRPSTLALLARLTAHTAPGTLFLVVDTASDISELSVGAEGRRWPAWMIVDALLAGKGKGWEKVRGEDSRWFRFGEGVGAGWATKLENSRYWYRLYRRV